MKYPEAIKTLRLELLLTQMELAAKLGVAFATVNRWENGLHEPTIKTKRKLSSMFKKHGILVEG